LLIPSRRAAAVPCSLAAALVTGVERALFGQTLVSRLIPRPL